MSNFGARVARFGAHQILGNRSWLRGHLDTFANEVKPERVLEIGSGKSEDGAFSYSMQPVFPDARTFTMTDINPDYGHLVLDVTDFTVEEPFDAILCISVLEHLPEPRLAIERLHAAMRPGGTAVIGVPFAYPLHDEPADYWRFTEHGLRLLLERHFSVRILRRGPRKMPTGLLAFAQRSDQ